MLYKGDALREHEMTGKVSRRNREPMKEQINVRVSETLRDDVDKRIAKLGFSNEGEYVRYLIRCDLAESGPAKKRVA